MREEEVVEGIIMMRGATLKRLVVVLSTCVE
jgi:hypothetical protein